MKNYIRKLIRIKNTDGGKSVYVGKISWPSPHEPRLRWAKIKNKDFETLKVSEIVEKIVYNKKYFRICLKCFQLNAVGHMFNKKICHSCAEKHLDVVF